MLFSRLKYNLAPDEAFIEYPEWRAKEKNGLAKSGAAFMSIISIKPRLIKGSENRKGSLIIKKPLVRHWQISKIYSI